MSKPAVLFIGTLPPHPGGSATVSASVLNGLDRLGHEVVAIAPLSAEHRELDRARIAAGIKVHAVSTEQYRHSSWAPTKSAMDDECRRISTIGNEIADAERPDVLLLGRADFKDPGLEIAARFDIPVVAVDHGSSSAHFDGFFDVPAVYHLGRLSDEADCIVSVAEYRAANLRANGIVNVVAIPNAADTDLFRPGPASPQVRDELGLPANARFVAHVSNMKPLKRIGDYLAAMARVTQSDPDVHALVVGEAPGRAELEAEARSLGLERRATFTGWLDRQQMAALYRSVELIVQPSETEAAPLVVLEAMASACPVVASDIRAHRELIENGQTGVLVTVGDVEALADSISELLKAPRRRHELAAAARETMHGRTAEKMAANYSAILSAVARSVRPV